MKFTKNKGIANVEIRAAVNALHTAYDPQSNTPNNEQRCKQCHDLIEHYFAAIGEKPEANVLQRMADYVLVDYLANQYKHTVDMEYPFHSERQVRERQFRHKTLEYKEELK